MTIAPPSLIAQILTSDDGGVFPALGGVARWPLPRRIQDQLSDDVRVAHHRDV